MILCKQSDGEIVFLVVADVRAGVLARDLSSDHSFAVDLLQASLLPLQHLVSCVFVLSGCHPLLFSRHFTVTLSFIGAPLCHASLWKVK